jgi:glutathione S-transferase
MLTLYDFGNSVCCQKVRITMRAKALNWESIKVDLFKTEQYDPNYLKLNPKGVVPTLVHDGKPVIESTLICEYIDDTFLQLPQLIPTDPWQQSLCGCGARWSMRDCTTVLLKSAFQRCSASA